MRLFISSKKEGGVSGRASEDAVDFVVVPAGCSGVGGGGVAVSWGGGGMLTWIVASGSWFLSGVWRCLVPNCPLTTLLAIQKTAKNTKILNALMMKQFGSAAGT